jgi:hypothetical protein
MSDSARTVIIMTTSPNTPPSIDVHDFFDRYEAALLARDEQAVARLYAVPSLILFPGQAILVTDAEQTATFFASSWTQYEGVREVEKDIVIMGDAPGTTWADVTWSYPGHPPERFCYQLVAGSDGPQIAVLTPMVADRLGEARL